MIQMRFSGFSRLVLAFQLLVIFPGLAAAIDTDVIIFDNGDRLTGEVKSLDRGMLSFKTEATGTISIEWENVALLSSSQNIQVETSSGVRYLGTLEKADNERQVVVMTGRGPVDLDAGQVVGMAPIDQENWRDWDVDVSLGYNFTSANTTTQFNVGAEAKRRTAVRILSASISSVVSDSSDNDTSESSGLELGWTRLRENRWLNVGNLDFTKNTQLGLNLRTSLGYGIGRIMTETNRSSFALGTGLQVSREDNINIVEDTDSLELYGKLTWDWFRYDSPEWDLSTDFEVTPSLSSWGRVRYEFDTKIKWEIFSDFYWTIELYDDFDSDPQSVDAANHDYGVITSITYDLK